MRLKMNKKISHIIEYTLARLVSFIFEILPQRAAENVGMAIGRFAWRVGAMRKGTVLDSIRSAFPDYSEEKVREIAEQCFTNIGGYFATMFRIRKISKRWMEENVVIENQELLDSALEEGKGVINVTFHFGNWELMGARVARCGYPLDVIARGQKNPYFHRWVTKMRESSGMRMVPVTESPRKVGRSLRAGKIVTFLSDQDSHEHGVFVDFLGRQASTPKGPALYALKTGAPVILSLMLPLDNRRWKIKFERLEHPSTDNSEEFIYEFTKKYTDRLAEEVRNDPSHWFWPHRRWKTPPPEK